MENEIFEKEKSFYNQNKEELLKQYEGKYVAIIGEEVIDSDSDFSSLAGRVLPKSNYSPVFMPLVEKEERQFKIATPKFIK